MSNAEKIDKIASEILDSITIERYRKVSHIIPGLSSKCRKYKGVLSNIKTQNEKKKLLSEIKS